uniref:GIR1-like zinc ribbon domain-containing protein n=1 Tax=Leersia perrieri TaxID=77586 RepID=A0A0D9VGP9_9ORYZ
MSRRSSGGAGLDLKLNLSLPAARVAAAAAVEAEEESSPSSCVSSEREAVVQWSDSPEATPMVLAACPRCFIYVMLAEADPRCPKCRSPVILDFLHHAAAAAAADADGRRHRKG